jgi:hypothetical protein
MNSYDKLMAALEAWLYDEDEAMNLGIAYNAHLKVEGIWLERASEKELEDTIFVVYNGEYIQLNEDKVYRIPQEDETYKDRNRCVADKEWRDEMIQDQGLPQEVDDANTDR